VDILSLCTDISKLLFATVSHRCSDSLLYFYLVSIVLLTVAHHQQEHTFPDFP